MGVEFALGEGEEGGEATNAVKNTAPLRISSLRLRIDPSKSGQWRGWTPVRASAARKGFLSCRKGVSSWIVEPALEGEGKEAPEKARSSHSASEGRSAGVVGSTRTRMGGLDDDGNDITGSFCLRSNQE